MKPLASLLAALLATAPAPAPAAAAAAAQDYTPRPYVQITHPEWSRDAVIYELNTRHFTQQGTLAAAQAQLPRLKALGVGIVWLMPIHPIGEHNRKGTLGSPYSVRDYTAVNPDFGTLADLKAFVAAAHGQGMHVILDLVANHTAWDHPWVAEHPDWYERDWKGDFHPTPWWDWSDIIDLDYSRPGVRRAMTDAMEYWVREADVDGYRADVAGYVPVNFWETARERLDAIKPVFLLAEWQERDLHARAFDATYAWDWYNAMHDIARGEADVTALYGYYSANESAWPADAMRMAFTENHDKNAWEATQYEAFGDLLPAAITLSFVGEGIPLIHNGQEACNERRLAFFEKDRIDWTKPCGLDELFTRLSAFKAAHPALWNGAWGGRMEKVETSAPKQVLAFLRRKDDDRVLAFVNLSTTPATLTLPDAHAAGRWRTMDGEDRTLAAGSAFTLSPGEALVMSVWR